MIREKRAVIKKDNNGIIIEQYNSVNAAVILNNISQPSISNCLNKRQKTAGGFIWEFVNINLHIKTPKMPAIFINDLNNF